MHHKIFMKAVRKYKNALLDARKVIVCGQKAYVSFRLFSLSPLILSLIAVIGIIVTIPVIVYIALFSGIVGFAAMTATQYKRMKEQFETRYPDRTKLLMESRQSLDNKIMQTSISETAIVDSNKVEVSSKQVKTIKEIEELRRYSKHPPISLEQLRYYNHILMEMQKNNLDLVTNYEQSINIKVKKIETRK